MRYLSCLCFMHLRVSQVQLEHKVKRVCQAKQWVISLSYSKLMFFNCHPIEELQNAVIWIKVMLYAEARWYSNCNVYTTPLLATKARESHYLQPRHGRAIWPQVLIFHKIFTRGIRQLQYYPAFIAVFYRLVNLDNSHPANP